MFAIGWAAMFMRTCMKAEGLQHPEYFYDTKFLEQYVTRCLQSNNGHLRGVSTEWNYQKGEWNEEKPFYYGPFPYWRSPLTSGQLGFSKWQK